MVVRGMVQAMDQGIRAAMTITEFSRSTASLSRSGYMSSQSWLVRMVLRV